MASRQHQSGWGLHCFVCAEVACRLTPSLSGCTAWLYCLQGDAVQAYREQVEVAQAEERDREEAERQWLEVRLKVAKCAGWLLPAPALPCFDLPPAASLALCPVP